MSFHNFNLVNASFPLIFIILIGYVAGRLNLIDNTAADLLTKIVFYIVLPATLFFDLAKIPITDIGQWSYVAAYGVISIFLAIITIVISKTYFHRSNAEAILNAMACNHTNTAYLALPVFLLLFHSIVPVAIIIILQSIFTLLILFGLELTTAQKKVHWHTLIAIILKNPILIGIYLGIGFSVFSIPLPLLVNNTLTIISQAASCMALLALGFSLSNVNFNLVKIEKTELIFLIFTKTILHPLLGFILGKYIFHLDAFWLKALVLMCAMPTAKNLFIFAQQYKIGIQRANIIVFVTTVISLVVLNVVVLLVR